MLRHHFRGGGRAGLNAYRLHPNAGRELAHQTPLVPHAPSMTTALARGAASSTRVRLHLKPGQKGTKTLVARYGDRLICVRYRYDARRHMRFTTVELIV